MRAEGQKRSDPLAARRPWLLHPRREELLGGRGGEGGRAGEARGEDDHGLGARQRHLLRGRRGDAGPEKIEITVEVLVYVASSVF